jgi:hypothetical protein
MSQHFDSNRLTATPLALPLGGVDLHPVEDGCGQAETRGGSGARGGAPVRAAPVGGPAGNAGAAERRRAGRRRVSDQCSGRGGRRVA